MGERHESVCLLRFIGSSSFCLYRLYRGLEKCLKDTRVCPEKVMDVCFTIAEEVSDYVARIAGKMGVPRV